MHTENIFIESPVFPPRSAASLCFVFFNVILKSSAALRIYYPSQVSHVSLARQDLKQTGKAHLISKMEWTVGKLKIRYLPCSRPAPVTHLSYINQSTQPIHILTFIKHHIPVISFLFFFWTWADSRRHISVSYGRGSQLNVNVKTLLSASLLSGSQDIGRHSLSEGRCRQRCTHVLRTIWWELLSAVEDKTPLCSFREAP